jgi:hypothetical protein
MNEEKPEDSEGEAALSHGERRVVERLRRAQRVAEVAAPQREATLADLMELAEMIQDEGG